MIFFITAVLVLFIAIIISIIIHLNKIFSQGNKALPGCKCKFSIIIAARNEEKNIPELIDSLRKINYPHDDYEVILADDNSDDSTYDSALNLTADIPNFKIVKAVQKDYPGKKGALKLGISEAENDFILITDADCRPEQEWLNEYSLKFSEGFDFLFGIAPLLSDSTLISRLSAFENLRSSLLSFSALAMGVPYTAAARNLGFMKNAFVAVKDYSNIQETLSGDDDLLLREAFKNKMKIGAVHAEGSKVYSGSKQDFKGYLKQKARHTKTSFYYLPLHKFMLICWHLVNLFFLFSPLLVFINPLFWILFTAKISADLLLVLKFQKKLGYGFNAAEAVILQVFYEMFIIVNFFNSIFRKDKW